MEAILASVHLMKIYDAMIRTYEGNCSIAGTQETGFYIQLVVGRTGGHGILPQDVDCVPVVVIYANFEEHLQTAKIMA